MQAHEMRQQLYRIDQAVDQAAQLCQINPNVNQTLKDRLRNLDRRSDEIKTLAEQQQDPNQLSRYIDELEQLSDQVLQACRRSGNVGPQLRGAIEQAHKELSDLKHLLH